MRRIPDLSAFRARGGKMIVTIGTDDTLASPGAQLDYFQSVIDRMGRATVDSFARFFVLPQTNHGLRGAERDHRRQRPDDRRDADSHRLRSPGADSGVGGAQRRAADGGDRHGRRSQPADVLVSALSEVHQGATHPQRRRTRASNKRPWASPLTSVVSLSLQARAAAARSLSG